MRFLLVGGFGRSGSSFLQDVLCRHPQISGGPEFNFTRSIFSLYAQMDKPSFAERNKLFYSEESLKSSFRYFYESFFKSFTADKSIQYISEKTPNNYFVTEEFFKLYPEGKFIFIFRDGRDAILSYRNVYKKDKERFSGADYTFKTLCRKWNAAMSAKKKLATLYPNQLLQVRYEDLVRNSETEIKRILKFLEVDDHENLTELPSNKVYHRDPAFHPEAVMKPYANPASIGKWKTGFSFWEKWIVHIRMSFNLSQEGYPVSKFWYILSSITKKKTFHENRISSKV